MRNSAGDIASCATGLRMKRQKAQTRKIVLTSIQSFHEEWNFIAIKQPIKNLLVVKSFDRAIHFSHLAKEEEICFWPWGGDSCSHLCIESTITIKKDTQHNNSNNKILQCFTYKLWWWCQPRQEPHKTVTISMLSWWGKGAGDFPILWGATGSY